MLYRRVSETDEKYTTTAATGVQNCAGLRFNRLCVRPIAVFTPPHRERQDVNLNAKVSS